MTDIDTLRSLDFFAPFDEAQLRQIASCASEVRFRAGAMIFREGDRADRFFVIREGTVALELHAGSGPARTIMTVERGDILGWSWLIPPHKWTFDARAVEPTTAVAFEAAGVLGACEANPAFGYTVVKRFLGVIARRLEATRLQLMDLYGR